MSKPCPHCSTPSGPAIKEVRRDAFKEAAALAREAGIQAAPGEAAYTFEDLMTLSCFLVGLGEDEDD